MNRSMALACLAALGLAGCAGEAPESPPAPTIETAVLPGLTEARYVDEGAEFSRILYEEGVVSVNDRCPVRKVRLNLKMPPAWVNGRPVGFC